MPGPGVFFDLDGTFADTAQDLAVCLNRVLDEQGHPPLPFDAIRAQVSNGASALIQLGFGLPAEHPGHRLLRERLLSHYAGHLYDRTRLFPGMEELLQALEERSIPWGIVTNKPARLTDPLMAGLGLARRAASIVSGDTLAQRKPAPEPLWHACREAACDPRQSLYVGDARRDIEAGQRAGMTALAVRFGYHSPQDPPEDWNADGLIDHPLEVLRWLPVPEIRRQAR